MCLVLLKWIIAMSLYKCCILSHIDWTLLYLIHHSLALHIYIEENIPHIPVPTCRSEFTVQLQLTCESFVRATILKTIAFWVNHWVLLIEWYRPRHLYLSAKENLHLKFGTPDQYLSICLLFFLYKVTHCECTHLFIDNQHVFVLLLIEYW